MRDKKIARSLQDSPGGSFYYRMVNTVLSRDKNWIRWKLEHCPPIFRDAITPEQYFEAKAGARAHTVPRNTRKKPMGALDLTFLEEADKAMGLEMLRDPARYTAPSIVDLVKGIETDELDMEMATDEERQVLETRKDSKTWRALRTASRQCLSKLDRVEPGKSLQEVFKPDENPDGPLPVSEGTVPVKETGTTIPTTSEVAVA